MVEAVLVSFVWGVLKPHLVELAGSLGGKVLEGAASETGKQVPGLVSKVWGLVRGKVEESPAALEAVRDLAESPGDEDYERALVGRLKKLLEQNPEIASQLEALRQEGDVSAGAGSVAFGHGAHHNAVVMGDVGGDLNIKV